MRLDYLVEPVTENDIRNTLCRAVEILNTQMMDSEYFTALDSTIEKLPHTEETNSLLEKLYQFLTESKDNTVTAETAAGFFGFNRDYFGRYFKSKTGLTFSEFYKNFTIEYAKLLLESGHFKIHDISNILGFSSPDYFTRVFKKATGKTPSEFRKV